MKLLSIKPLSFEYEIVNFQEYFSVDIVAVQGTSFKKNLYIVGYCDPT